MLFDFLYPIRYALVTITLMCSVFYYGIMIQVSVLNPETASPWRKRFAAIIASKYFFGFCARAYILYLWFFAIGDDPKLFRRFKIILNCSTFIVIVSLFFRLGMLILPILYNPWILLISGIIFGLNGLFRLFLRVGSLTDQLIRSTPIDKPKPQIQIIAENIELANYYFYFSLNTEKSSGQIRLARQINKPNFREDCKESLDRETVTIYLKHLLFCMYVSYFCAAVIYLGTSYFCIKNITSMEIERMRNKPGV